MSLERTPWLALCVAVACGGEGDTNGGAEAGGSAGTTGGVIPPDATGTVSGPSPTSAGEENGVASSSSSSSATADTSESGEDSGPGPIGPFDPDCPAPDLADLPEWVPGPGAWAPISMNTLADVDPCPASDCPYSAVSGQSGLVAAWNGGAFACHEGGLGGLVRWGGGHNDYWGNEVYLYDLATRQWTRRSEPSESVEVADPDNGEVADGNPSVPHTYEMLDYHPATNSLVMLRGQAIHNLSSPNGAGHMFSFETNTWRRTANIPAGSGYGNSAFDRARGIFWASAQYGSFVAYDPGAPEDLPDADGRYGTATEYHSAALSLDTMAAIDPNNDVYVIVDMRNRPRLYGQDLADPGSEFVELTHQGPVPSSASGFEWVSEGQRFYAYTGPGQTLWSLRPPKGDWRTESWQWEAIDGAGQGPPTVPAAGLYGAFRWAPAIQCFVTHGGRGDPVFAYRPDFGG